MRSNVIRGDLAGLSHSLCFHRSFQQASMEHLKTAARAWHSDFV